MNLRSITIFPLAVLGLYACQSPSANNAAGQSDSMQKDQPDSGQKTRQNIATNGQPEMPKGSFAYDQAFIHRHDSGSIVLTSGDSKIILSPKYQAKVFTSTASGDSGQSFGWIHYKAFEGPEDAHMNAYGGENRLWLGPEGGKFSLFFPKGAKMEFTNWKTPAPFDTEPWQLTAKSMTGATLEKTMHLANYAGEQLDLSITRNIQILTRGGIDSLLKLDTDRTVHAVGYRTENTLINTGNKPWTEATGMPCLWLLDMFNPSAATTIIIPYRGHTTAKPATTDYFGEIPADRIRYQNNILFFRADGKHRGKLGVHPQRARPMAGSYDAVHGVLTVTLFDTDANAKFLNQEWNTAKPPFSGDAVNAYNDGPLGDGSQMGPFYELESVSPAALLGPGHSMVHRHSVFHFTGPEAALGRISQRLWGLSLDTVKKVF
ncbi:MAG TPA: DUF6786 family protein [Puia sp.]|nr:DUF6786 family protein [Puia sp.]